MQDCQYQKTAEMHFVLRGGELYCKFADMKTSDMSWFAQFLNSELEKRFPRRPHGSLKAFADLCSIGETTMGRWLNDENKPSLSDAIEVLHRLGGDISRALPDFEQPLGINEKSSAYQPEPSIRLVGSVSAGSLEIAEPSMVESVVFADLWRNSPWWHYTNACEPILLIQVRGDSMAPTYPNKSFIAVRRPSGVKLPNGAPCVFRDGDEVTFKLLMRREDGVVSGLPLNQDYDLVAFKSNPVIDYVALGCIQPKMSVSMKFDPPRHRPKE